MVLREIIEGASPWGHSGFEYAQIGKFPHGDKAQTFGTERKSREHRSSRLDSKKEWSNLSARDGMCARNSVDEGLRIGRRRDLTGKDLLAAHVLSIECLDRVLVLVDHGAIQRNSAKHALAARVSENRRLQFPIGACFRIAANRTGCCRSIAANLELIGKQCLHS